MLTTHLLLVGKRVSSVEEPVVFMTRPKVEAMLKKEKRQSISIYNLSR